MIKVMVVIYGLVMLVPHGSEVANCDDRGCSAETLTVILLESDTHEPMIRWVGANGGLEPPWELPDPTANDFQVKVTDTRAGDIDLAAWTWFPRLHELSTTRVKQGCWTPNGTCEDRGQDLTHGVVELMGDWSASPATYCQGFKLPIGYHDSARMKFPRDNGDDRDRFGEKKIGTAVVLTATLDSEEEWRELQVTLGSDDQKPAQLLEESVCREWIGDGIESCAVLLVGNRPRKRMSCTGHEDCRYDRHFSEFYRLTTEPGRPQDRRIPFVTGRARCPEPDIDSDDLALYEISRWLDNPIEPQNMPSVRCPPTFALSE